MEVSCVERWERDVTIEVWHGGGQSDPRWFTTDRDWAATFGDPVRYRLRLGRTLRLDADTHPALQDETGQRVWGYDEEWRIYDLLDRSRADALIIEHWEGTGLCILIAPGVEPEALPEVA
jgi:hypothetical protein